MLDHLVHCSTFKYVSVDTEGLSPERILGVSLAHPMLKGMYFPFGHKEIGVNVDDEVREKIQEVLLKVPFRIFHNAAHDLYYLPYTFDLPFIDTMIMGHMVDENLFDKGLDSMHKHFCGGEGKVKDPLFEGIKKSMGWEWIPIDLMNKYATQDSILPMEIFLKIKDRFVEEFGEIWSAS